ncbi:MAG: hypothetical protein ACOWYE_00310 [Desulfatiglandales bacterium]
MTFEFVETTLKDIASKGVNGFQGFGMNHHLVYTVATLFQMFQQLTCGDAVKITRQLKVQGGTVMVHIDSKIGCHGKTPIIPAAGKGLYAYRPVALLKGLSKILVKIPGGPSGRSSMIRRRIIF